MARQRSPVKSISQTTFLGYVLEELIIGDRDPEKIGKRENVDRNSASIQQRLKGMLTPDEEDVKKAKLAGLEVKTTPLYEMFQKSDEEKEYGDRRFLHSDSTPTSPIPNWKESAGGKRGISEQALINQFATLQKAIAEAKAKAKG